MFPPLRSWSSALKDQLGLGLVWLGCILLVNPRGNFPLCDDWSYALGVKHLLETGSLLPTGWAAMTLVTHTLWGALFCLVGGFSFNVLRLAGLTASLVGLLATYRLLRQVHPSRLVAGAAALVVGLNPIYFILSNSFMTDVTFTMLLVLCVMAFLNHLRTGSDLALVVGTLLGVAATLCRQVGLAGPLAFALTLLWYRGLQPRWLLRALLPLGVGAAALLLFEHWMGATGRLSPDYHVRDHVLRAALSQPFRLGLRMAKGFSLVTLFLGWFGLPVLLLLFPSIAAGKSRLWRGLAGLAALIGLVAAVGLMVANHQGLPLLSPRGNAIVAQGMGPLTLRDTFELGSDNLAPIGGGFWPLATGVALIGDALVVAALLLTGRGWVRGLKPARLAAEQVASVFFLLCLGVYLVPFLAVGFGSARYLVPILPLLLGGLASGGAAHWQGWRWTRGAPALAAGLLLAVLAVGGTHDYLEWNRTRWRALDELLADGTVRPAQVDGGFEFNGLHFYDPAYKAQPDKSWWWVQQDDFVVGFGPMENRLLLKEYAFSRWLPPGKGRIVVLKKRPPQQP